MEGHRLYRSECCSRNNADSLLTESRVELVQAEMAVVVVVVVPQQVLHGALQQSVLHVLLHGDLTHVNKQGKFITKSVAETREAELRDPDCSCRRYKRLAAGGSVTSCPGARRR